MANWTRMPVVFLVLWAAAAEAQLPGPVIESETVAACLGGTTGTEDPGACVTAALAACLDYPPDEAPAAATLCFRQAAPQWGRLIAARMTELEEALPPDGYAATQINARYDLLANMLQCERMNALAEAGSVEEDRRALQQARCEATAPGLVYVRLMALGSGTTGNGAAE